MEPLRKRYDALLDENQRLRELLDKSKVELVESRYFATPDVQAVIDGDEIRYDELPTGTFVGIPPEAFQPTDVESRAIQLINYAHSTGHELIFTYNNSERWLRVYEVDVRTASGPYGVKVLVEGYAQRFVRDSVKSASTALGGYRSFNLDRMSDVRLKDPTE